MMGFISLASIKLFYPIFSCCNHLICRMFTEFNSGAVAHTVDRMLEIFEQLGNGFSIDSHWLLQRFFGVNHSVDAAMSVIPVGVADIMLHMTNDDIVPIRYVEGSVGTEIRIRGAHVPVIRDKKITEWSPISFAGFRVAFELIVL